jgi:hypothetical protein
MACGTPSFEGVFIIVDEVSVSIIVETCLTMGVIVDMIIIDWYTPIYQ